jgi:hypothetical protein
MHSLTGRDDSSAEAWDQETSFLADRSCHDHLCLVSQSRYDAARKTVMPRLGDHDRQAWSQADGFYELIDEPVPGLAAMLENIEIRGEEKLLESQFSRMNCQMFSTGLSSGNFAGRAAECAFVCG